MVGRTLLWTGIAFAVLTAGTGWAQPAQAAEVRLSGIIPGAGVVTKKVESMRERRYAGMVPQRLDFSCGAAAIATILTYAYDRPTSETDALTAMLAVTDKEKVRRLGFSLLDIKNYAQSLGLKGMGFKFPEENIRTTLDRINLPIIVLLDLKGYKHFVVFRHAEGEVVHLADPALGNRTMRKDDFLAAWNNIALAIVGEGYDKENALREPIRRASARRLLGTRSAGHPAPLLEFGVGHANLF